MFSPVIRIPPRTRSLGAALVLLAASAAIAAPETRTWTARSGASLTAACVRCESGRVWLRDAADRTVAIQSANLSEADLDFLARSGLGPPLRTWTALSGLSVTARVVGFSADQFKLVTAQGKPLSIPAAKLSAPDRAELATNSFVAPADFLPGAWSGTLLIGEWGVYHLRFQLAAGPPGSSGKGVLFANLTDEQLADPGKLKSSDTYCDAFAADLACTATASNGELRVSAKVKMTYTAESRKERYAQLTLNLPLRAPGWGIGACDLDGTTGVVFLARDHTRTLQPLPPARGQTHRLACDDGVYHYTLYVPARYDPARPTPLLVNDNPGKNAQPLHTGMAEELGWIMIGLTESGNDTGWRECFANSASVLFDVQRKLNIDPHRIYFSGFSGGSRRSAYRSVVHVHQCAGLLCIGAGYMGGHAPLPYAPPPWLPVFFVVGATDMNNGEVEKGLYPREQKRLRFTELIVHPGGHTWGRAADHVAGLKWLEARWPEVEAARRGGGALPPGALPPAPRGPGR